MSEPGPSVSESASLERGYRRLLAWYPKWFRLQNTEEVLAVLMACAVWLWLAWMSSRGKQRGRVAFAVFFGVTSLSVLYTLSQGSLVYAPAAMSVGLGIWAIAAAAIMLIFNKASSPYFQRWEPALA
jgi:hypothetical protein